MREERNRERESSSTRPRSIQYYRPSELGGRRSGLTRNDDFPALTRSRANVEPATDEDDPLRTIREFVRANETEDFDREDALRTIREYVRANGVNEPDNIDRDESMRVIREFVRANEADNTDHDERIRTIRDFIRRPLTGHPENERTMQSVHNLLYHTRREPALPLTPTDISHMLDQASTMDSPRRSAGSPSRVGSSTAVAARESSASARRRAQIERIHAFNRATVSAMREANPPSARDAWTPQRYYAAVDTYVPTSGNANPGSATTSTSNGGPTPASTGGARTERASLARQSLARQAQLEIRRQAVYLRRDVADPRDGVSTAGLAWSEDGGTLWVGCSEGVWEVEVNLKGRMGWSVTEFA